MLWNGFLTSILLTRGCWRSKAPPICRKRKISVRGGALQKGGALERLFGTVFLATIPLTGGCWRSKAPPICRKRKISVRGGALQKGGALGRFKSSSRAALF